MDTKARVWHSTTMKRISVGLLTLTVIVAASIVLQVRENNRTRGEIMALRAELGKLGLARRESTTTSAPLYGAAGQSPVLNRKIDDQHLVKLREEVASLRNQVKESARTHEEDSTPTIPVQLVPSREWKNAGKGTPSASIETFYWAALGGEVNTLADSIVILENDRAKFDAWFASLSETTRQQYGSPERLAGLLMAKEAGDLAGMQILGQRQITDADVLMQIRCSTDKGDVGDTTHLLCRTGDGWRVVVDANWIDALARRLRDGK